MRSLTISGSTLGLTHGYASKDECVRPISTSPSMLKAASSQGRGINLRKAKNRR